MSRQQHPSLARIYRQCSDNDEILFIDESFQIDDRYEESFYTIIAALYPYGQLEDLREDLREIISKDGYYLDRNYPYWHSTEAFLTPEGKRTFVDLLKYLSENEDSFFVTCQSPIPREEENKNNRRRQPTPEEQARRNCLKELLAFTTSNFPIVGAVFEARKTSTENDRDKRILKNFSGKVIPTNFQRAWVSPRDENALWVPDIVGMAYRRTRTHSDITSQYFGAYIENHTRVKELTGDRT